MLPSQTWELPGVNSKEVRAETIIPECYNQWVHHFHQNTRRQTQAYGPNLSAREPELCSLPVHLKRDKWNWIWQAHSTVSSEPFKGIYFFKLQKHPMNFMERSKLWCVPEASVRNPTRDKVMRQRSDGQGESDLRVSPWYFLSMYPKKQNSAGLCTLLFHSSDTLWKKSTQGFSLLHLEGMFQLNPLW